MTAAGSGASCGSTSSQCRVAAQADSRLLAYCGWAVTSCGTAAAIPFEGAFDLFPFVLAVLVALVSWLLVLHYNRRTTGARNDAKHLVCQMKQKGIDYDSILGTNVASEYSKGSEYDKQELTLFMIILIGSVLLPLLPVIFRAMSPGDLD